MKRLNRQKFSLLLLIMSSLSVTGGCGTETYNQRLDETKKLFSYINELNENLGPLWNKSGVEIRMPRQFTEIPPPPMELNEHKELVQIGEDERQPHFSSVELPGLIGAWKGSVETVEEEEEIQADAYAYVLSNAYLLAKSEPEEALNFASTVVDTVVDGLNLRLFDDPGQVETYGDQAGFVTEQSARVWRVAVGKDAAIDETHDVSYELSLHLFQKSDIQIAVLFIYPKNFTTRERMLKRIDLALETIKISSEVPKDIGGAPTTEKPTGTF